MMESQRVVALLLSNMNPPGNGGAVVLDLEEGALVDIGQNSNLEAHGLLVTESPDDIVPALVSVSLNYGTGVMSIEATEAIDSSTVDLTKIDVSSVANAGEAPLTGNVELGDATVVASDAVVIEIHLTEKQRVHGTAISGTPGGDLSAAVLDLRFGSIRDLSGSYLQETIGLSKNTIDEAFDTISPAIESIDLYLDVGKIVLHVSEAVNAKNASNVDLEKARIVDIPSDTSSNAISLAGATVEEGDAVFLVVRLNETQRVAALQLSGSPGGDGSVALVDMDLSFFSDIGLVPVRETIGFAVNEIEDKGMPLIESVSIDYGAYEVVVHANETINAGSVDLSKISAVGGGLNFDSADVVDADGAFIKLTMTEEQHVKAIQLSGTKGGDSSALEILLEEGALVDMVPNPSSEASIVAEELEDLAQPQLESAHLSYSTGKLVLKASETLDIRSENLVDFANLFIVNNPGDESVSLVGATVETGISMNLNIYLTEEQRVDAIVISGSAGGDNVAVSLDANQGAAVDLAGSSNSQGLGIQVSESDDVILPDLLEVNMYFGTGELALFASETIENLNVSRVLLSDVGGTFSLPLNDSSIAVPKGSTITLELSEETRISALRMSAQDGGDGAETVLDILPDAVFDAGTNALPAANGVKVLEHPDLVPPVIDRVGIHYGTGKVTLFASEALNVDPISNLDLSKIVIHDKLDGGKWIPLTDSSITAQVGTEITLVLPREKRLDALAILDNAASMRVVDLEPALVSIYPDSVYDVAGNRNQGERVVEWWYSKTLKSLSYSAVFLV